jgi:hypothetical protein
MFTFCGQIDISRCLGADGKTAAGLAASGIQRIGTIIMDAKLSTKEPKNSLSGLDTVRQRAHKQKEVRLKKTDAFDVAEVRITMDNIKTLKEKSCEELPPERTFEPSLLRRIWSNFQVLLGNR